MILFEEYKRVYNNYQVMLNMTEQIMEYAMETENKLIADIVKETLLKLDNTQKLGNYNNIDRKEN